MSETKHTPGPWAVADKAIAECDVASSFGMIANVHGASGLDADDEGRANAVLVARAPDLLRERDELAAALALTVFRSSRLLDATVQPLADAVDGFRYEGHRTRCAAALDVARAALAKLRD